MEKARLFSARKVLSSMMALVVALSMVVLPSFAGAAPAVDITKDGYYTVPAKVFKATETDLSATNTAGLSSANNYCKSAYIHTVDGVSKLYLEWSQGTMPPNFGGGSVVPSDFKVFESSDLTGAETAFTTVSEYPAEKDIMKITMGGPGGSSQELLFPAGEMFPKEVSSVLPAYALSGDQFVAMSMNIFGMPAAAYQKAKLRLYIDEATPMQGWFKVPATVVNASVNEPSMAAPALKSPAYIFRDASGSTLYTQWGSIPFLGSLGYITKLQYFPGSSWSNSPLAAPVSSVQYKGTASRPKVIAFPLNDNQDHVFIRMFVDTFDENNLPPQNARIKLDLAGMEKVAEYLVPGSDPAPAAPAPTVGKVSKISLKSSTYNKATLAWTKVAGATGYTLSYKLATAKTWSTVKTTATSKALKLKTGKKYQFKVKAYKTASGKTVESSAFSNTLAVTPKLAKITGVKVKKASRTASKVSWKKTAGANKYVIYQKVGKGKWKKIKTTSAKAKSFTKKGLKRGKTYYYKVRAYNTAGKSFGAYSKTVKLKLK